MNKRPHKVDPSFLDSSARDMSIYYHPDFRGPPPEGQYQTVYSPEEDREREKAFILRLKTKFAKHSRQAWPQNEGSIYRQDAFIDGFEEVGKLERGSKSPVPRND